MFKSIVITALRNITRNRSFSLINVAGLSLSMSLGLLIILIVKDQYTYDNFHRDSDRIFRVNTQALRVEGGSEPYACAPLPIGTALRDEYTFAEEVVRINNRISGDAIFGTTQVPVYGLFADPSFLQVFNFPLEKGNAGSALNEPNSLVLTVAAVKKIFGAAEPLGQLVTLSGYGTFKVTGVLQELPGKTHFEFEILASLQSLPAMEKQGVMPPVIEDWNNYYGNYVYVKMKEGHAVDELEQALVSINKTYYTNLKLETRDRGYNFYTQALADITPGPMLSNNMGKGIPTLVILVLGMLTGVVMIMACFNYTNLMIAKSLSRAREIGVRKIVGGSRAQLFVQFVGESVLFSLICLAFSYILLQGIKPFFLELSLVQEFSPDLTEGYGLIFYFVIFAVGTGCVAGVLPAAYLSAFRPASVLKDAANPKVYLKLTFRKILIVTQFSLSIVFIILVMVIYRQVDFMIHKDYGIHDKDILNVRLQGMDFGKLAHEVRKLPGVIQVGGVSHALGTFEDRASDYKRNPGDEPFVMRDFLVDGQYVENLGLEFVAGKNFETEGSEDRERFIILNENALRLFGFPDAAGAVGQAIYADDSVMLTVIGVVRNFHFRPMTYEIGPVAFRHNVKGFNILSARISPAQKEIIIPMVEAIWKKADPVHPFVWSMMENEIDNAYSQSGYKDVLKIVGYVSFLAISLACLGMLGMAMYATRTRTKEIGVRKVLGGNALQITFLLSRTFLVLLGIAAAIGAPAGYLLGEMFLTGYAYKISISPLLVLAGIFVVGFFGLVMVASQTMQAAASNPVDALRSE